MALAGRRGANALRAMVVLALAAAAVPAAGSNYSLYLEPGYLFDATQTLDSTGRELMIYRNALLQNYRLGIDLDLAPNLVLSGSGNFLDTTSWIQTNGDWLTTSQPNVVANARLIYSTPLLNGGLQYDYNQLWGTLLGASRASQTATFFANWRPADLPQLDLRLSRSHNYDEFFQDSNNLVWSALAGIRYAFRGLDLRYYFTWVDNDDQLRQVTTSSIDNLVQATYSDSWFGNRLAAYASAVAGTRSLTTSFGSATATVAQQKFPIQGLSLVDSFPATPVESTLAPNPALIDGNLLAPAGLNIGWGPSVSGDRELREAGVEMAGNAVVVNLVYLWVDRQLPPAVVAALVPSIAAYQSNDNVRWTPVPLAGPVVFGAFNNRLEIPIADVAARYVKVVVAPLPAGVTSDRAFSEIQITEMQVFENVQASSVPPRLNSYALQASGTLKAGILRGPNLDYDLSLTYNKQSAAGFQSYTIVNGLSLNARLGRAWSVLGRVARQDSDPGAGHESQWQWSASLVSRPLNTVYAALSYSGQVNDFMDRQVDPPVPARTILQSLTLFGRADVYEGVSVQASLSGTNGLDLNERATNSGNGTLTLSLVPNRWATLTTSYVYTVSFSSGGFLPDTIAETARLVGTLVLTPIPALSVSATANWVIVGPLPALYSTFSVNYSPLQGDLQFAFLYSRSLDTATSSVAQYISPTIRWTIRPGVFLNASYIQSDNFNRALETRSRGVTASLIILL